MMDIRSIRLDDIPSCEVILRSLPQWFGIEQAILDYCENLKKLDGYVATTAGEIVGFVGLKRYQSEAIEIDVLAVTPKNRGKGIGSQLLNAVVDGVGEHSCLLHLKTLAPSSPDKNYAETRAFWSAKGFASMDAHNLWGDADPCLVMVKPLNFGG